MEIRLLGAIASILMGNKSVDNTIKKYRQIMPKGKEDCIEMKKIEELATCKKCKREEKYYRDEDDHCAAPEGWNLYSIRGSDESPPFLCPSCISHFAICERCSKVVKKSKI